MDRLRIAGIVGSLREGSYNRMLLHEAMRLAPDDLEIVPHDIGRLPLFNEDVERYDYPQSAVELGRALEQADGLLVVTPEYNYGMSGVLKNAIDWASRPPGRSPLQGLPAAIIGASQGMGGTARAQLQVRDAFVFTQTPTLPGPEVLVAGAQDQFDEDGRLTRDDTREFVQDLLARFAVFARHFQPAAVS